MSEEKTTKKTTKEVKKLKVVRSSVGTQLVFKGEPVILNNGLSQKLLKEMKAAGFKCIVNE